MNAKATHPNPGRKLRGSGKRAASSTRLLTTPTGSVCEVLGGIVGRTGSHFLKIEGACALKKGGGLHLLCFLLIAIFGFGSSQAMGQSADGTFFISSQSSLSAFGSYWYEEFTVYSTTRYVLRFASDYVADAAIIPASEFRNFIDGNGYDAYTGFSKQFGTHYVTLAPGDYYVAVRNDTNAANQYDLELDHQQTSVPGARFHDIYFDEAKEISPHSYLAKPFTIQNGFRYFLDGGNSGLDTHIIPASQLENFASGGGFQEYPDYGAQNDSSYPGYYELNLPVGNYYLCFRNSGSIAKAVVYTLDRWASNNYSAPPNNLSVTVNPLGRPDASGVLAAISGAVRDSVALSSFTVTLNGVPLTLDSPLSFQTNSTVPWRVSGVQLENGINTVVAAAVDVNGRKVSLKNTVVYVNSRPELAGTFTGRLAPGGTVGVETIGVITVKVTAGGVFTGKIQVGGHTKTISGVLDNSGQARFKPGLSETVIIGALTVRDPVEDLAHQVNGFLSFSVNAATGLSGAIHYGTAPGDRQAAFSARRGQYSPRNPVPVELLNQPSTGTPTRGFYTIAFTKNFYSTIITNDNGSESPVDSTEGSIFPQGNGYATLTLKKTGAVSLAGTLADGSKFTAAGVLRADQSVSFFASLYANAGGFEGDFYFEPNALDSDVTGVDFLWVRPNLRHAKVPPNAYSRGWPAGFWVNAVGTKYARPASLNFGEDSPSGSVYGNVALYFTDGLINQPATGGTIEEELNLNPANGRVTLLPSDRSPKRFSLNANTGIFTGIFKHSDGTSPKFGGILLNKGGNRGGKGYFLSTPAPAVSSQGGSVLLEKNSIVHAL